MALFISCDPEDIMRQAEESTLRYHQGTCSTDSIIACRVPRRNNDKSNELNGKFKGLNETNLLGTSNNNESC